MVLPPTASFAEIAKNIDDLVRTDFEAFRDAWFHWLLFWTLIVAFGLLFELPEIIHDSVNAIRDLFHIPTPSSEIVPTMKLLVSVGWLLIVLGVMGEFVADSFVSKADGIVTTFNETLLADTQRKTGLADERAASAFERAAQTEREASQENERAATAEREAQQENERAAKALDAAETARKDAEGFQLQIAQANERAANAEQRAKEAEVELARITKPRSLLKIPELVSTLKQFKGTEYTYSSVCQEQECLVLLQQLDSVLQQAEWTRVKAPGGFPAIKVFGVNVDFAVPVSLADGIAIRTEARESLASLQAMPIDKLPQHIRAAITFNLALFPNLDPPQGGDHQVDVEPGDSTIVQIAVGKKKV